VTDAQPLPQRRLILGEKVVKRYARELHLSARFVKRDFNWWQFEEDFDIIVELEGLVA